MRACGWPERVDFPGEPRHYGEETDRNEYYVEVHEPRHYPNGPAFPLKGPTPENHPVKAAARAKRHAIRVHRDRFVEARRFLHAEIEAGRVEAVRHWWYDEYCEMDLSTFLALLQVLEVDLDVLPGSPDADAVSADVGEFISRLERGEESAIRVTLGMTTSEWNPYLPGLLWGEDALRLFAGSRYVPEITYRLNGMRI